LTPSGTPKSRERSRIDASASQQMAIDSATATSLDSSALLTMRASTSGGTLMPSHLMKCIVLGRPHGAKLSTTLAGCSPRERHSSP